MLRYSLLSALLFVALWGDRAIANSTGDAIEGQKLYQQCRRCHQTGEGARHRIGPHLNGIYASPVARHEDYRYSKALRKAGKDGMIWDAESLDAFLENPRKAIAGTKMGFQGLKDPAKRMDLIAYLQLRPDEPAHPPEAALPASDRAHDLDPAILSITGDPEYGEYLSSECTTCHQRKGGDAGIPSIINWPEQDFVIVMHAYKNKQRANPVMQMMAGRLNAEEIAALAAYFGALEEE